MIIRTTQEIRQIKHETYIPVSSIREVTFDPSGETAKVVFDEYNWATVKGKSDVSNLRRQLDDFIIAI